MRFRFVTTGRRVQFDYEAVLEAAVEMERANQLFTERNAIAKKLCELVGNKVAGSMMLQ